MIKWKGVSNAQTIHHLCLAFRAYFGLWMFIGEEQGADEAAEQNGRRTGCSRRRFEQAHGMISISC